jgi:hypothetical protein
MKTSLLILVISLFIYIFIEHTNRRTRELLNEIEQRGNHFIDEIDIRIRLIVKDTLAQVNNQTTEQVDSILDKSRKHIPLKNPYGATTCTDWFGCHNGYCWTGCAGAFPSITGPEWCYTTKSTDKIPCSDDKDCNGCWRCSSPCTV